MADSAQSALPMQTVEHWLTEAARYIAASFWGESSRVTTFTTPLNQVSSLYVGYFGRAGDPNGESYWIGQLNAGTVTLSQIAASFSVQPEATAKYPYLANPNIGDPGTFVDQVYQNMFNHTADAAG